MTTLRSFQTEIDEIAKQKQALALATASTEKDKETKGKGKAVSVAPTKAKLVKTIPVLERVEAVGAIAASEIVPTTSSTSTTAGRLRFYTGGARGCIRIWDATDAKVIASYGTEISQGSDGSSEDPREIVDVMFVMSDLS